MSIAEKSDIHKQLLKLYQKCKMDSLNTLLTEKQEDLKYQQTLVNNALDPEDIFSDPYNKLLKSAITRRDGILGEIALIQSHLPKTKTYGFKKSVKAKKAKKSPKKSPKKAKKSPKKAKK
jgi:hypothetical protein